MTTPVELTNVPGVELIRTGQWQISTGKWDVNAADLASAVAALNCPAVRKPRLKLGHVDPRFNASGIGGPAMDGEPAVGWVDNIRIADNGQTLVGDYTGVPGWLGAVMASAYPDRSVEGFHDLPCALGHTHPFVLTGVALLGVTPPGVGTLKSLSDVAQLYGVDDTRIPDGAVPVAATIAAAPGPVDRNRLKTYWTKTPEGLAKWRDHPHPWTALYEHLKKFMPDEMAKRVASEWYHDVFGHWPNEGKKKVAAEADIASNVEEDAVPSPKPSRAEKIRAAWNSMAPESRWIVEVGEDELIVTDDSDRSLYRVPVAAADDGFAFGEPVPVRMAYVPAGEPVAASRTVFASRAESRPADQVYVAAGDPPTDPAPVPPVTDPQGYVTSPDTPEPPPVQPAAEPEPQSTPTKEGDAMSSPLSEFRSRLGLPDDADEAAVLAAFDERLKVNTTETDPEPAAQPADDRQLVAAAAQQEQFAAAIGQIQTLSAELAAVKAEKATERKQAFFAASVQRGAITPAERESWETRYDKAPDLVTEIIGAMADGTAVPVAAAGHTGSPDVTVTDDQLFAAFFSPEDNARLSTKEA